MALNRFEVYLVNLDPTIGSEIKKTRPCLIVSPDEMNHNIRTVIVAPMTTKGQDYPSRVACRFKGKDGQVVLDVLWVEVPQHRVVHLLECRFLFFSSLMTVVGLTCSTCAVSRMPLAFIAISTICCLTAGD